MWERAFEDRCPDRQDGKLVWAVRIAGRFSDVAGDLGRDCPNKILILLD
jgi:hypothetical protein